MKKLCTILGFILVIFIHSPASNPDTDVMDQFKREADLQGYKILAVSCLSVRPLSSEHFELFEWTINDVGLTVPSGNPGNLSLFAQVNLPDGAEIKRMVALYYDNSALANIEIAMGRGEPLNLSEPDEMFYFSSETLPNNTDLRVYSTSTIQYPIIDNRNVYIVMVDFDAETNEDVAFRSLYIAYE
jgi:hypothetical protein